MLYQEQPDGTGRISNGCNRDGSRAPHWCITGGLHPRSSVTLRLATTGHAARVPPAPHQCRAAGFRRAPQVATRGTGRTPQPPPPPHVGQQSKTARYLANILSSSFREVRSRRYRKSSCRLQQLIGIIHGTITIDVSGGGGRYAGGRPPKFDLKQRAKIKQIALSRPADHDLPFSTWSLSKLADFLVAEGVVDDISHEGLRTLLRAEGVSFPGREDLEDQHRP